MTIGIWTFCAVSLLAFSEDDANALHPGAWLTPQNILSAVVLAYHFGMVREQINALKRTVEKLDEEKAEKEETNRRLTVLEVHRR